jgi:hypothetical protein
MKPILLEMVADLEDLRANLAVIAAYASRSPTISAARDAKSLAMREHGEFYRQLRAKIEKLPLSE